MRPAREGEGEACADALRYLRRDEVSDDLRLTSDRDRLLDENLPTPGGDLGLPSALRSPASDAPEEESARPTRGLGREALGAQGRPGRLGMTRERAAVQG